MVFRQLTLQFINPFNFKLSFSISIESDAFISYFMYWSQFLGCSCRYIQWLLHTNLNQNHKNTFDIFNDEIDISLDQHPLLLYLWHFGSFISLIMWLMFENTIITILHPVYKTDCHHCSAFLSGGMHSYLLFIKSSIWYNRKYASVILISSFTFQVDCFLFKKINILYTSL